MKGTGLEERVQWIDRVLNRTTGTLDKVVRETEDEVQWLTLRQWNTRDASTFNIERRICR